ncbi:MAG: type restriction/modification system, specificity subunit [Bacteroidota bacterium]
MRFPKFDGEWERKKVGELCDSIVPGRNKPNNFTGNIPWITTPDIEHNGTIIYSKKGLNISKEEAKKIGSKIVPINSIVISCVGDLGLSAIVGKEIVINQQLHAFIPKEKIEYRFLLYQLNLQKRYMDTVATKTAVPYMNKENCNSIPIAFPSLPEQKKIASFLSIIDERIQTQNKIIEELKVLKSSISKKIFSQQLRFKDNGANDFPDWKVKNLGEICEVKKGKQLNKEELTVTGEYPCINGGINASGYTDKFNSLENTITISEGGNSCGYINFFKVKFWSGGHNYSIEIINDEVIDNDFLFQLLKYNETEIMKLRIGSGLPNIQKKALVAFPIAFPILKEEQTKIANFLSSIDKKIKTENQISEQYQMQKQYLLHNMFV